MLSLNPLAAALQGIGFGTLLTALQGLWAATTVPEALPIEPLGPARPRHRIRRWAALASVPAPWELVQETERQAADEDEALLLAVGAL